MTPERLVEIRIRVRESEEALRENMWERNWVPFAENHVNDIASNYVNDVASLLAYIETLEKIIGNDLSDDSPQVAYLIREGVKKAIAGLDKQKPAVLYLTNIHYKNAAEWLRNNLLKELS